MLPHFPESCQICGQVLGLRLTTCASNESPELAEARRLPVGGLAQLPSFIIFGVPHPEGELK